MSYQSPRTHTFTGKHALDTRIHTNTEQSQTTSMHRTFTNGAKLQAITQDLWCKKKRRSKEPLSLRSIIWCLPNAFSNSSIRPLQSLIPNLCFSHCVFFGEIYRGRKHIYIYKYCNRKMHIKVRAGDKDYLRESMMFALISLKTFYHSI